MAVFVKELMLTETMDSTGMTGVHQIMLVLKLIMAKPLGQK